MKLVLFISLCLLSNITHSQNIMYVKGYPRDNSKSIAVNIFTEIASDPKCEVNYQTLKIANDSVFYIIGDSVCGPGIFSNCYVIAYTNGYKYYSPKYQFKNTAYLDSQIVILKSTSTTYKDRINSALLEIDSIKKLQAKQDEENVKTQIQKELKEIDSLQKVWDKYMTVLRGKNLVLYNWSWNYPNEYSSFTDVSIEVINPFKQKIKYISFTFQAFNAVDDPVKDGISGATLKSVKGIGPIGYGEKGSYKFESVFYSKIISTMRITQIKIQFFDGATKTITNPVSIGVNQND